MVWNRNAPPPRNEQQPPSPEPSAPSRNAPPARLGASLVLKGTLTGQEDLVIEGRLDGEVRLEKQSVTIGQSGRLEAEVYGRTIVVEGEVHGDLFGTEEVIIRRSGKVLGNVKAPRVTLENGARFKGSIDMQGADGKMPETAAPKAPEAAARKPPPQARAAAGGAREEAKRA